MAETNRCKNCDHPLDPSYEYCPKCGQEVTDNLTFGVLFSKTISDYFSVDARFFRSFFPLIFKPGVLARRFVDGKRLYYLHPAQFYLFISVVFFFLISFSIQKADNEMSEALKKNFEQGKIEVAPDSLKLHPADSLQLVKTREMVRKNKEKWGISDEEMEDIDSVITETAENPSSLNRGITFDFDKDVLDSLIAINAPMEEKLRAMGMKEDASLLNRRIYEQVYKLYVQRGGGILQTFFNTIPIAMFLLMPIFALLLKIFYWRRGNFAHHMVFSFYFFTFLFTAFCILFLANKLFDVPTWLEVIITLSYLVYLMVALRNFYRSSWIGAFFKANVISFMYMLLILPVATAGIIFMAFMLY
ncbi:Protein of unknown function [Muriicola jejuensis]|uniref:DUF3667 domain-containing protein n=1 Tax=Muriicola jejuensis TaxID=504488 RepID=A0A6P0U8Z5_9FLAO|nr:DUF3667 domain-containing protein [Muriicola jejuensis]NER09012.1 DUF3667 domain-containing protein [Muriicola jejuensis]SMP12136.1 Protein of unknown function [Muriicola jejuensis]